MDWHQFAKDAGVKGAHGHSDKQMLESALFLAAAGVVLLIITGILAAMGLLK